MFSSVHCIYFDSAQTNPVAGFIVNIVKCEQDGNRKIVTVAQVFIFK